MRCLFLSEPSKTHLMLLSCLKRPKMSNAIDMVGQLGQVGSIVKILIGDLSHSEYHPSLHLLWQSRHSLNTDVPSSADLTCFAIENILLLPHLKQVYSEFSKASCNFSNCLIKRFILSLTESKNRMFHLFFPHFSPLDI